MSEVTTKYSPMHIDCEVGQPYGVENPNYSCGFHTGIDFPQSGVSEKNPKLYSVTNQGRVIEVRKEKALGNIVLIFDEIKKLYFRYCHLLDDSTVVKVGDDLNLSSEIGRMGNTGNSTGTHLHLECSKTKSWECSSFIDPGEQLGIPNVRGTIVHWEETIPPKPTKTSSSLKWLKAKTKRIMINI